MAGKASFDVMVITLEQEGDGWKVSDDSSGVEDAVTTSPEDLDFEIEDRATWVMECLEPEEGSDFAFLILRGGEDVTREFERLLPRGCRCC